MTCQCGLDRDFGGLKVADLPHHDNVRILPDNRAQTVCKRETDLRFHLDLVNPVQLIFHWILDGNDLLLRVVNFLQCGVKGGCLPTARGACHQDHPVRLGNHIRNAKKNVGVNS